MAYIVKNVHTVSDELLEELKLVSVSTASHTLVEMGYRNAYMQGIMPLAFPEGQQSAVGRAVTLRFVPLREDLVKQQYDTLPESPHREALESIMKNDVLVIDTGSHMETGVVGDIFTRRLRYLGGQAIIVDGCVRDLQRIKQVDFPVLARGVHGGAIPRSLMSVGVNEPIRCGGVTVIPGDIILADRDGCVAIPPQCVEEIVKIARAHDELEERWIKMKLDEGASLHTHYPPNAEARLEFEQWKKENGYA
ncbi:ribonuclease activity regulator RraA [Paenibacillus montanisoli]|uniref:Putative 4-hydroxy-4-methyl-2-oxoglutarate aldolase n=1 Tax=Paenibacillus montanisoli TaxID=2081970 RepID=A0A328TW03_9BACL|nr:ribonuclease activity regulator RraA [Paenibacillus montanisoli]RAP74678.1 ribonuclease activity regulator RraA [Paenibacillus montanisoli]